MARPLHIEYPGAYYHVMNRGLSRRDIFLADRGRESFLDLLSDITRLWKVEIHAYCLRPSKGVYRERCGISMGYTPRGSTEPIIEIDSFYRFYTRPLLRHIFLNEF